MRTRAQRIPLQRTLESVREEVHSRCVVCGARNTGGLHLDFAVMPDGTVQAEFDCANVLEGYPHTLHGGMIASLLDGAMTNCLFSRGIVAVTAELTIRFLRPVATNRMATVRAWLEDSRLAVHWLGAELRHDGQLMAAATGKFIAERQDPPEAPAG
jgi:uncharacterized protein (TIGR00369 family)